jgi:hypothetical protein
MLGAWIPFLVLGGLILCMVAAEAAIDWPVFPTPGTGTTCELPRILTKSLAFVLS